MALRTLPVLLALAAPLGAQEEGPQPAEERAALEDGEPAVEPPISAADLAAAGRVAGLELTDAEIELMLEDLADALAGYERRRAVPLSNAVPMALVFDPWVGLRTEVEAHPYPELELPRPDVERPADLSELVHAGIPELAALVRAREVSCEELARVFLARLREVDEALHCVVAYTEERALARARALDGELAEGRWRGPLHGIPWGAKDLLAARGTPTTWGARTHAEQVLDLDAAVVERLDESGAVLVAKLTLGALAWGDVWFGGRTRNPWNPEQGSSGSSAGSAAATAAGGVAFAIGSETLGSIVSPSERCGTTSLRPTFGRVSRHGAMALSWSMDKLGPICRSVVDADLVFAAIQGPDPRDPATAIPPASRDDSRSLEGVRIGVPEGAFEHERFEPHRRVLEELEALGFELVPVAAPDLPAGELLVTLNADAAAAFEDLTLSGRDDELTRQGRNAWPNVFRQAHLVSSVQYVQANRVRTLLVAAMDEVLRDVDLLVHPSFAAGLLTTANLTGHPTVVAPAGFRDDGTPYGISFTGKLHGEPRLLSVARAWQESTDYHLRRPPH